MLSPFHRTHGAEVPKVACFFDKNWKPGFVIKLGKLSVFWAEESDSDVKVMGDHHTSHGWLLKGKRQTFCYKKGNQRFFFIKT